MKPEYQNAFLEQGYTPKKALQSNRQNCQSLYLRQGIIATLNYQCAIPDCDEAFPAARPGTNPLLRLIFSFQLPLLPEAGIFANKCGGNHFMIGKSYRVIG